MVIDAALYWNLSSRRLEKRAKRVGMQMNRRSTDAGTEKRQAHRPERDHERGECSVAYVEKGRITFGSLSLMAHVYCHVLSIVRSFCCRVVNVFRRHDAIDVHRCVVIQRGLLNPRGIPLRSEGSAYDILLAHIVPYHSSRPSVHAESVPSVESKVGPECCFGRYQVQTTEWYRGWIR